MKKYQGAFIKNEREIACLREANRMVANILDAIGDIVKPGETTMRFEELARDMCADYKVKPAFLGYYGYPYATCCSVNEQVVHGFPSPRLLEEGDIVSVDMGVVFEGFVGDAARTFSVGKVSEEACKLMRVTEESLYVGLEQALTLRNGMVIAIEPMVTAGSYEVDVLEDKWTAVTRDRRLAAHFEHSVAITPDGPRILSISDRGLNRTTIGC